MFFDVFFIPVDGTTHRAASKVNLTKGENSRYYALIIGSSIFTIRLKERCFYGKESMRQIVLQAPGEFIERQVPEPSPEPGHALLRMRRVGVCGSDFHAYRGTHPAYTYPRILGHELAGEVLQAPADQNSIKQGDRCAIEPYWACGHCPPCLKGRTNCCDNIRVFGIHIDGGLQGVLSVPVHLLHKSASLNFDQLALVETLGIGAHAVHRSGLEKGESALVIGAGPIGLAVMQFAQAAGADVVVVEKNKRRREFAASFGVEAIAERRRPHGECGIRRYRQRGGDECESGARIVHRQTGFCRAH